MMNVMYCVTVALLSIIATHGLPHTEIADASRLDELAGRSMNNGLRGTGMVTSDRRRQLGSTKSALYGKFKEDRNQCAEWEETWWGLSRACSFYAMVPVPNYGKTCVYTSGTLRNAIAEQVPRQCGSWEFWCTEPHPEYYLIKEHHTVQGVTCSSRRPKDYVHTFHDY